MVVCGEIDALHVRAGKNRATFIGDDRESQAVAGKVAEWLFQISSVAECPG